MSKLVNGCTDLINKADFDELVWIHLMYTTSMWENRHSKLLKVPTHKIDTLDDYSPFYLLHQNFFSCHVTSDIALYCKLSIRNRCDQSIWKEWFLYVILLWVLCYCIGCDCSWDGFWYFVNAIIVYTNQCAVKYLVGWCLLF